MRTPNTREVPKHTPRALLAPAAELRPREEQREQQRSTTRDHRSERDHERDKSSAAHASFLRVIPAAWWAGGQGRRTRVALGRASGCFRAAGTCPRPRSCAISVPRPASLLAAVGMAVGQSAVARPRAALDGAATTPPPRNNQNRRRPARARRLEPSLHERERLRGGRAPRGLLCPRHLDELAHAGRRLGREARAVRLLADEDLPQRRTRRHTRGRDDRMTTARGRAPRRARAIERRARTDTRARRRGRRVGQSRRVRRRTAGPRLAARAPRFASQARCACVCVFRAA